MLQQIDCGNPAEWDQFIASVRDRSPVALLVMPCTNLPQGQQAARLMAARAGVADAMLVILEDSKRVGFVQLANKAFRETKTPFFGYVAQDAFPGRDWLKRGLTAIAATKKGLLGFNDGKWAGGIASFGLVRRTWAEKNYPDGNLFFPGYQSHYADLELTVLALAGKEYVYDPNAVLTEVDWEKDGKPNNSADKALYAKRSAAGFGLDLPETLRNYAR